MVYENLCRELGEEACAIAPWRHYVDGQEVRGWRECDAKQPFEVRRLELFRPLLRPAPMTALDSLSRLLFEDLPLRKRVLLEVFRSFAELRPDVVVLGELHALGWLGQVLHWTCSVPTVYYIHGEEITTGPGSRLYGRRALASLRRAEAVVAVSSFTQELLIARGVHSDRIHTITNGVDLKRFRPGPKDDNILKRHGLEGKKILLTVARIEQRKGHDRVIEALPSIMKAEPEVAYIVVGEGGYEQHLRQLAVSCGVADRVIFTGLVPWEDVPRYYRSCDIFVMPNRTLPNGDTEGFGLVFLEANACEKPVIGGRAGGVPDAVLDGETGLLVNGERVDEVASAVTRLLQEMEFASMLGRNGFKRVQGMSWAIRARQFRDVCSAALKLAGRERG